MKLDTPNSVAGSFRARTRTSLGTQPPQAAATRNPKYTL